MAQSIEPAYPTVIGENTTIVERFRLLRRSLTHLTGGAALLLGTLALTWLTASVLLLDTLGVIGGALLGTDVELAGDCKVVFVNGEPDHCVVVIPGTDTPVQLPSTR